MKTLFAALLLISPAFAAPAPTPVERPKARFSPCVMPFGCGASGGTAPSVTNPQAAEIEAAKKKAPAKREAPEKTDDGSRAHYYSSIDPLAQELRLGEITSAIRLDPADTGTGTTQVLIRRQAGDLALPGTTLPKPKKSRTSETADWAEPLETSGAASGRVNAMRDERDALRGDTGTANGGVRRMWGDQPAAPSVR